MKLIKAGLILDVDTMEAMATRYVTLHNTVYSYPSFEKWQDLMEIYVGFGSLAYKNIIPCGEYGGLYIILDA